MIGAIVSTNNIPYLFHLYDIQKCDLQYEEKHRHIQFVQCTTEQDLIHNFFLFVQEYRVCTFVGYNTTGFDWNVLHTRAMYYNIPCRLNWWFPNRNVPLYTFKRSGRTWHSMGDPEHGLHCIDLYCLASDDPELRLNNYTLDSVSKHILGDTFQKHPITYSEHILPSSQVDGSPEIRYAVGVYCVQDVHLCVLLDQSRGYVRRVYDMCRMCGISPQQAVYKGVMSKLLPLMCRYIHDANLIYNMPTQFRKSEHWNKTYVKEKENEDTGEKEEESKIIQYKGGYVHDPVPGVVQNLYILDYMSLYPSIIMAYNLCPTMYIGTLNDPLPLHVKYMDVPVDSTRGFRWIHYSTPVSNTILPRMQSDLMHFRKEYKKKMKCAKQENRMSEYQSFDSCQRVIKIIMNATYGAFGSRYGSPCPALAETITALGRHVITETMRLVTEWYPNLQIIYCDTDSVMIRGEKHFSIEQHTMCMEEIALRVTEHWKTLLTPGRNILILEAESFCTCAIFEKKKKYAYVSNDKICIKGMITERRDNPKIAQNILHVCLRAILIDNLPKVEIEKLWKKTQYEMKKYNFDVSSLVSTCRYSQSWEEYIGIGSNAVFVHARSVVRSCLSNGAEREYTCGDRIPYVILKHRAPPLGATLLSFCDLQWPTESMKLRIRINTRTHIVDACETLGRITNIILPFPVSLSAHRICIFLDHVASTPSNKTKEKKGFKCNFPTSAALSGMRVSRIEKLNTLFGSACTLTFLFPVHSVGLCAEDPKFVSIHDIDVNYYCDIIERNVQSILDVIT
jgi:DNA polymerase elongation subunit (family B)